MESAVQTECSAQGVHMNDAHEQAAKLALADAKHLTLRSLPASA